MADVFIGTEALETGLPFVTNPLPTPGAVAVLVDTDVSFTVQDDVGGTGIDQTSIDVTIGGVPAVVDGVFQAGYTGSIVPNGNGFDVVVNPDVDLPGATIINVVVFATDLAVPPNEVTFPWSFTTEFVAVDTGVPSRWQWRYAFRRNPRSN
jgi:hypothetical protein